MFELEYLVEVLQGVGEVLPVGLKVYYSAEEAQDCWSGVEKLKGLTHLAVLLT